MFNQFICHCFSFLICVSLFSCSRDTQIGENEFIHNNKIYKLVDNEILLINGLDGNIRKYEIEKPELKNYGGCSLEYIKAGAYSELKALYRGDYFYYILTIEDLNDLKDKYSDGIFSINLMDEYGFLLHEIEVETSALTGVVGEDNKTIIKYSYNGKTQMSQDIYRAISTFSVSSTVRKHSKSYLYE